MSAQPECREPSTQVYTGESLLPCRMPVPTYVQSPSSPFRAEHKLSLERQPFRFIGNSIYAYLEGSRPVFV